MRTPASSEGRLLILGLSLSLLLAYSSPVLRAQTTAPPAPTVPSLTTARVPEAKLIGSVLNGIRDNQAEAFSRFGDPALKARTTPQMVDGIHRQIGARLRGGYKVRYLGRMRQADLPVHLYVVEFGDGGDDLLARMILRDDEIVGFYLH